MIRKEYSAAATKLPFWFMEFRKEVGFLAEGKTFDEIRNLANDQNVFGASTPQRAKVIYQTVTARIKSLGDSFYTIFEDSDIATQKLFALAGIMANDTLFFDFVYEVIREKMLIGSNEYADSDVRIFFNNKQLQDKKVAGWTDASLNNLRKSYKNYLFEAGMTDNGKTVRKIKKPILDPIFENWLKDNDMELIADAMTGEK